MTPTPTTPVAWLNWLLNQPEDIAAAKERTARILGDVSPVNATILLVLLDHHTGDGKPITSHTITIETGRQISFSQINALQKKGMLTSEPVEAGCKGIVTAWRISAEAIQSVTAIRDGLAKMILRQNQCVEIYHRLSELAAEIDCHIPIRPDSPVSIFAASTITFIDSVEKTLALSIPDHLITHPSTIWNLVLHIRKNSPQFA